MFIFYYPAIINFHTREAKEAACIPFPQNVRKMYYTNVDSVKIISYQFISLHKHMITRLCACITDGQPQQTTENQLRENIIMVKTLCRTLVHCHICFLIPVNIAYVIIKTLSRPQRLLMVSSGCHQTLLHSLRRIWKIKQEKWYQNSLFDFHIPF